MNDRNRAPIFAILPLGLALLGGCDRSIESTPLPERPAVEGKRFTQLTPEQSGIEFTNLLKPEHVKKYLYDGSGLSVGDYDGDGLPDLYLVSLDGPNKLYRNLGDMKFEDVTAKAGGLDGGAAWGTGATFFDFDGDGDLDLFVCNLASANLLFVNQGNGKFVEGAEAAGLAHVGASIMGAVSDYDGDGDVDLYLLKNRIFAPEMGSEGTAKLKVRLVNGRPEAHPDFVEDFFVVEIPNVDGPPVVHLGEAGQADILYRNNGDGTFTDVTEMAGIEGYNMGLSATWWDYNDDNLPDLYVANDMLTPDRLYRNQGGGRFSEVSREALPHTPNSAMGADFSDIDNDGRLDFLVGDMAPTTHFKQKLFMGNMPAGNWQLTYAEPRQYMRNALYLNTGTPRFAEAAYLTGLAKSDWTWAIRFGDLDNDGFEDVFITNGMAQSATDADAGVEITKLLDDGKVQEAREVERNLPPLIEANLAFRNLGDLKFESVGPAWGLDLEGVSHGASLADLDRDGDLDVVVNNLNQPLAIYRNESVGGNRILVALDGPKGNSEGLGARVTLDAGERKLMREATRSRGYLTGDEPLIHFGLGEAERVDRLEVRWPSGAVQVLENLPANRTYRLREAAAESVVPATPQRVATVFEDQSGWFGLDYQHSENLFDDFERESLLPNAMSTLGPGMAWGDMDGDGDLDLWVGGASGQAGVVFENQDGKFNRVAIDALQADADSEDMGGLWFDADSDGDMDLYVVSGGNEGNAGDAKFADRLYLNEGAILVRAPADVLPAKAYSGSGVAAADYDRDGDLDLFVGGRQVPGAYPNAPPSRLLRNEGGRFVDVERSGELDLADMGMVTGGLWTDVDNDGRIDLLVVGEWTPIRVFLNSDNGFVDATERYGLADTHGWWNGIVGGDIDHDGDIDYVVTNFGLNTKYHASLEAPVRLYAADFDGDGRQEVVEAEFEDGKEYPVRGRSCSSNAMPFIAEKFPTFRSYAAATLNEIYPASKIERAGTLRATHLEHVVLINQGGKLEMRPLPRIAQIAPAFGAAIADFDGDGNNDIVLAQNFYGPQIETGRMAGGVGQFLRGRGDGFFDAVRPTASGFVVADDARAMSVADINGDGRPDVLTTGSNGRLRLHLARGTSAPSYVPIDLAGTAADQENVGARVTTESSTGRLSAAEIYAGGGYLSQGTLPAAVSLRPGESIKSVTVRWPDGRVHQFNGVTDFTKTRLEPPPLGAALGAAGGGSSNGG